jgi:hypothetical protein
VVAFAVVEVDVLLVLDAVVDMALRYHLLLLLQRAFGGMTFYCAFVALVPLAFFFLLPFLPLFLSLVWTDCFFIFRGAVDLLPMLIWRLTALA